MKCRILNYGVAATHSSIVPLPDFNDRRCISDYDGIIIDPKALTGGRLVDAETHSRRQNELRQLVHLKGGLVICILRPRENIRLNSSQPASNYNLLAGTMNVGLIENTVKPGEGSKLKVISGAKGAMGGYFRVLQDQLRFEAYLDVDSVRIEQEKATVFAVNSSGLPIAVEFLVNNGRLCFVPLPNTVAPERLGSAFARIIEAHFGQASETEAPSWVKEVLIPGATAFDSQIAELESQRNQIDDEISGLNDKRSTLINFRKLLFESGLALENVVRVSLRLLGFEVPEPESYSGEWDVELHEPVSGETAIAEIEGSEGLINIDKYRQLLDYVQSEVLNGQDRKGILIGNGFRLKPQDENERRAQFSDHALRGASRFGTCLLPTTELFKAVCAVLEKPENHGLQVAIRRSILEAEGVWIFGERIVSPEANSSETSRSDAQHG
jgi:hypothetical protein